MSDIRTRYLSDTEAERLYRNHPQLGRSYQNYCPTCDKTGTYHWRGHDYPCDCEYQLQLHKHYLAAGIGVTYQRLDWDDYQGPTHALDGVQKYLNKREQFLKRGIGMFFLGSYGCIQGGAEININRGGKGFRIKLRDLVRRFNGEDSRYGWNPDIPTYVQREVDGVVRLAKIANAWFSGVKTTYTVTTDSGRQIRATDEHPFLTERGWLRLDELKVDDEVHVIGQQAAKKDRQGKLRYRYVSCPDHPFGRADGQALVHRLTAEAQLNGMSLEEFREAVQRGCTLEFLDPAVWAVHHKDHDSLNNDPDNLQVLTHADHHRLHAEEGKTNSVLFKITTEKVVSVEKHGEEETFDIEVEGDPHNFIANGFVVHNTGKTMLANLVLKELVKDGLVCFATTFSQTVEMFTAGWTDKADKIYFQQKFINSQVLLLDDVGKELRGTRIALAETTFDAILRQRVQAGRTTFITTNMNKNELEDGYGAAILSLIMEKGLIQPFEGNDFRPAANDREVAEILAGEVRPII